MLQVLGVLAVFGLHVLRDTARTRSIWRFCTADTAKILEAFWGPILTAGGCTPCTHSIWAFSTAHTNTRSIHASNTLILSVLGVRNVLDTPSILGVWSILGAFVHRFKDLAIITPGFWDHVTGVYSISHFTGAPITRKYN